MRFRRIKPATPTTNNAAGSTNSQSNNAVSHSGAVDHSSSDKQWEFKIVFLGNSGVGKTWLMERVLLGRNQSTALSGCHGYKQKVPGLAVDAPSSTIGVTVNLSRIHLDDGSSSSSTALLQLWDTSGADRYRNLVRSYVPGAHCIVIMYEPSGGLLASRQALARWYAFAKDSETTAIGAAAAALFAVVAVSRRDAYGGVGGGGDDSRQDEATTAGVNFGRVFASSLCGCFFHQRGGGGGGRRREGLTPRWLADQLVKRQQSRADAAARLLAEQANKQVMLAVVDWRGDESTDASADDAGCFWCQRLLCCRPVKCSGGCGVKAGLH